MLKCWHAGDLFPAQVGPGEVTDEHVTLCSSSDHSDIVTLGDSSKEERAAVEGDGDDDDDDNDEDDNGLMIISIIAKGGKCYCSVSYRTGVCLRICP